jgi:hypothetical protein
MWCHLRISGVMVSALAQNTVDSWFAPRWDQTWDYKIGICCFSAQNYVVMANTGTGWVSGCCLKSSKQICLYHGGNKLFSLRWCALCTKSLLGKQQSTDIHVTPFGHIILILRQPIFALSPECCVLIREAANAIFNVFGLTQRGSNPHPRSVTFEASTLTITPRMRFLYYR